MSEETRDPVPDMLGAEAERILSCAGDQVEALLQQEVRSVLGGKVLSAGPSRSGNLVQVRIRVGKRLVVSAHALANLLDQNMNYHPLPELAQKMQVPMVSSITSGLASEKLLKERVVAGLSAYLGTLPRDLLIGKTGRATNYGFSVDSFSNRAVHNLGLPTRILSSEGVVEKCVLLALDAARAMSAIPHQAFGNAGRRLEHMKAKKALLAAMKAALVAGVTDAELEELKNEALVHQVMQ